MSASFPNVWMKSSPLVRACRVGDPDSRTVNDISKKLGVAPSNFYWVRDRIYLRDQNGDRRLRDGEVIIRNEGADSRVFFIWTEERFRQLFLPLTGPDSEVPPPPSPEPEPEDVAA